MLSAYYGGKSAKAEAQCKAIFEELNIGDRYREYEENAYKYISEMMDAVDEKSWGKVQIGDLKLLL